MKCTIPEISWHNREPVLSVDIQPLCENFYRLATGGADCHVLIWQLTINENGGVKIDALSDLTRHQRAVNSVRWAPGGLHLATADDDANIIVWQLKTDNIPLLEGETNDKETWIVHKVMRGHKEDIYDLCWSPDGLKLLSGSIDNTAILWDFTKGKNDNILKDHKGFVQGVAWDPKSLYLATISTDRVCRIFDSSGKQVKARISRGNLPVPEDHYLYNKDVKFFHDDTFKSFFRRLDFSPDGSLLVVPSGRIDIEDCKKILNGALVFAVDSWGGPVAVFPTGMQCSTVVRFCPILFELHKDGPDPIISLPFRMIVAIGSDHDVILYDTQQMAPFAYFKDIHYTRLTDLTWSKDGLLLVASSTDGYCSIITFEPKELGVQYIKEEEEEESVLDISGIEELEKEENVEPVKPKKPSLLEQWTIKTPKREKVASGREILNEDEKNKRKREEENKSETVVKRIKPIPVAENKDEKKTAPLLVDSSKNENQKTPKRITPILVKDKTKNNNTTPKTKDVPPKVSPLLSFLKSTGSKEKVKKKQVSAPTLAPVNVILDEIEARDAWKCEKNSSHPEPEVIHDDDYTEDFSLHLEDTNNSQVEKQEKSQDDCQKKTAAENKTEDKESTENSVPKEKDSEPVKTQEDKVNIPKRRIPLITLSSPKHKKK